MIPISLQVKAQVLEWLRALPRWELPSCALSLGFFHLTHLQIASFLLSLLPSQASLLFSKPSRHTPLSAILPRNSFSSATNKQAFFSHLNISVCSKFTLNKALPNFDHPIKNLETLTLSLPALFFSTELLTFYLFCSLFLTSH